ncbi:hypothetical protein HAX54_035565 [Datura stramonium]|uniref:F-box protein n=1 Tax=Datura stramonium TaxID=4076 RepID=A0ABS8VGY1_DATST|nr:hypothetical protein [Datura stramonium]
MACVKDDMMTDSSDEYWEDDDYFVDSSDSESKWGTPLPPVSISCQVTTKKGPKNKTGTPLLFLSNVKFSEYDLRTAAYKKGGNKASEFPVDIITLANMKIKDVAKRHGQDSYYFCNPATEDWKKLPPLQYYHGSDPAVVLAFDPQLNIESFYHVVAAVSLLDHPVVCFEIYYSESDSWRCSPSDCLELENTSLAAVLHVPIIQSEQRGALTQLGDEVCYVTAYNDSENVFVIDIYGGVDMSLKHSVSVNLGSKEPHTQVFGMPKEESCEVLPVPTVILW